MPPTFTISVIPTAPGRRHERANLDGVGLRKVIGEQGRPLLQGENNDHLITLELPASIASAIVSPRDLPKPRIIAPRFPVAAVGMKIAMIASQRVAPIPKAASRILGGTATTRRARSRKGGQHHHREHDGGGNNPGPLKLRVLKIGIHPDGRVATRRADEPLE